MSLRDTANHYLRPARLAQIKCIRIIQAFMDPRNTSRAETFSAVSKYRKVEMIANALFVVMAILAFLSISGSLIHIFKNLRR